MDDGRILLLEQKLDQINLIVEELKVTLKEQDDRIKQIEMSKEKTEFQYEQIMQSLKTLNDKTIPNLTAQIEELKNKPVKRYDQVITAFLGAIVGAVGSFIASLFIK